MGSSDLVLGGYIYYNEWAHSRYNFYRISTRERAIAGHCSYETISINRYYNARKLNNKFYYKYNHGLGITEPLNNVGFCFIKSRMFESFSFYINIV